MLQAASVRFQDKLLDKFARQVFEEPFLFFDAKVAEAVSHLASKELT